MTLVLEGVGKPPPPCDLQASPTALLEEQPSDNGSLCGATFAMGYTSRRTQRVLVAFSDRDEAIAKLYRLPASVPAPGQLFLVALPGDHDIDWVKAIDGRGRVVDRKSELVDDVVTNC